MPTAALARDCLAEASARRARVSLEGSAAAAAALVTAHHVANLLLAGVGRWRCRPSSS